MTLTLRYMTSSGWMTEPLGWLHLVTSEGCRKVGIVSRCNAMTKIVVTFFSLSQVSLVFFSLENPSLEQDAVISTYFTTSI